MTRILALGLRVRPLRRLMGRLGWPRPEHLNRLTQTQFAGYVRSIGAQAEAEAALAIYRGGADQSDTVSDLRSQESRAGRRRGAAVP